MNLAMDQKRLGMQLYSKKMTYENYWEHPHDLCDIMPLGHDVKI